MPPETYINREKYAALFPAQSSPISMEAPGKLPNHRVRFNLPRTPSRLQLAPLHLLIPYCDSLRAVPVILRPQRLLDFQ